ncbi:hypothetical protein DM01DRAFT_1335551 [Hesseltinella vesiculosa]|uniref:Uncharacterized protein n=1 Tax=Hesseltinella vesiculosa TaxID=101127 RepID=A0A1X2GI74_9FUNG|nr:hypothetical protein DM01DRAFT_1335551 [Hesseltinella vesiculosa]
MNDQWSESNVSLHLDSIRRYYAAAEHRRPSDYLQDHLPSPPPLGLPPPRRERKTSTRDIVMDSPRSATFPYHNDDHFLPTAERYHTYSPRQKAGSVSSQSVYSQRTITSTLSAQPKYIPLATVPRRASSAPPQPARRNIKPLASTSASARLPDSSSVIDHWVTKLSGLFGKKKKQKTVDTRSGGDQISSMRSCRSNKPTPVWFSEYSGNPPPRNMVMAAA